MAPAGRLRTGTASALPPDLHRFFTFAAFYGPRPAAIGASGPDLSVIIFSNVVFVITNGSQDEGPFGRSGRRGSRQGTPER